MKLSEIWSNGWAVLRAKWYLRGADVVGGKTRIWGHPVIHNGGKMQIGGRFRLFSTLAKTELVSGVDGILEIGESVFINYGCSISASKLVRIGDRCNIGTHCMLMDNDFHRIEPSRRDERPESRPIVLEENVWLGGRVIVLNGVTIGKNSVIGAGSVVTKDIPPNVIAAGVPAKVIRSIDA
jgi:acetyltransferase-like isoleucine patch superfamily enzyme